MAAASPTDAGKLLSSFAFLLGFWGAGVLLVEVTALPIPGSVVGMILLAIALGTGLFDVRGVEPAADALLSQLGLLFVAPAVAVTSYFDTLAEEWVALLGASVGSLFVVLWVTGVVAQFFERPSEEEPAARDAGPPPPVSDESASHG